MQQSALPMSRLLIFESYLHLKSLPQLVTINHKTQSGTVTAAGLSKTAYKLQPKSPSTYLVLYHHKTASCHPSIY